MAAALEFFTVPRASAFPTAVLSPISTSSSSSSLSSSLKLPEFRGLKVSYGVSTRAVRSLSSRSKIVPRSSRIVCDSSESTLQLPSATEETWKSLVLESDLPVMVEFWAPWCGPCRIVEPVIDELSKDFAGKIKVFKVNTDDSPTIASDYGVRSIPTVIIFKNGEKKEAIIGAVPKSTLTSSIEKFL
ncbi:uncharacterized protein LOC104907729 [Beta vulgaris subsp. vulgaris]|uniref:uncharacterized protein LOC104907729 n=1 Tax=Beta vulgaris subsp. vulgaris TaxID=3555 RepID=UPI0020372E79|nr:uncharacterized protein LOC104907729 [Beta vulgaris subsp. vulgaris]